MGHQGLNFLETHPLLDRPFHPHQTHPVLVFHQFAHCPYPPVAEMVDVVDGTLGILEPHQITDRQHDILGGQGTDINVGIHPQLGIDFETADHRKIVGFGIKE